MSDSESSDFPDSGAQSTQDSDLEQTGAKKQKVLKSRGKKRSRIDPEYDDDSEDDPSREYDEEGGGQLSNKRKKKSKSSGFFIEEAEVDSEEEEEEEWEDGAEELLRGNEETRRGIIDDEFVQHEVDSDGHRRLQMMLDGMPDDIEEYYRRKYAQPERNELTGSSEDSDDGNFGASADIQQQTVLPSAEDPMLWIVKCRLGEERATALNLMRKFITYQGHEPPLQILSVTCPEGVKGYIYIEAFKQTHVKAAIDGLRSLRLRNEGPRMLPIKEMTEVLRVTKPQPDLRRGQWVRPKRGMYRDDLAQISQFDSARNIVELKLIPRIDYTKKRDPPRSAPGPGVRPKYKKPPQKMFDVEEIRKIGGEVIFNGDFHIFERRKYSPQGFLYQAFKTEAILTEGVRPTLAELQRFDAQPENLIVDIESNEIGDFDTDMRFSPGDAVIVAEGDLAGLTGLVMAVEGPKIIIFPKHNDLKEAIDFPARELRKFFKTGDHVKVINGCFENETGMVIRVDNATAILLSDLTKEEVRVRTKDLRLCADIYLGVDSRGQYQHGDLVQLDLQTVGVIVRIERDNFQIFNQTGKVVTAKYQEITRRVDSRRAVTLDLGQNAIHVRDIVRVIDGQHRGRTAEVKHIFRSHVFLQSKFVTENSGMFVCRSRQLSQGGDASSLMKNAGVTMGGFPPMTPRISSPRHSSFENKGPTPLPRHRSGFGRGGPHQNRRDSRNTQMIGKTYKITKGPYKGHCGIVRDASQSTVRLELHSKCQTITVDCTRLQPVSAGSRVGPAGGLSSSSRTFPKGFATPVYGNQTPRQGSQTPLHEPGDLTRFDDADALDRDINVCQSPIAPWTYHRPDDFCSSTPFYERNDDEEFQPPPSFRPTTPRHEPDPSSISQYKPDLPRDGKKSPPSFTGDVYDIPLPHEPFPNEVKLSQPDSDEQLPSTRAPRTPVSSSVNWPEYRPESPNWSSKLI